MVMYQHCLDSSFVIITLFFLWYPTIIISCFNVPEQGSCICMGYPSLLCISLSLQDFICNVIADNYHQLFWCPGMSVWYEHEIPLSWQDSIYNCSHTAWHVSEYWEKKNWYVNENSIALILYPITTHISPGLSHATFGYCHSPSAICSRVACWLFRRFREVLAVDFMLTASGKICL